MFLTRCSCVNMCIFELSLSGSSTMNNGDVVKFSKNLCSPPSSSNRITSRRFIEGVYHTITCCLTHPVQNTLIYSTGITDLPSRSASRRACHETPRTFPDPSHTQPLQRFSVPAGVYSRAANVYTQEELYPCILSSPVAP